MSKLSIKYSVFSTIYIAIAIPAFLLILKPNFDTIQELFFSPKYVFPIICTFLSGYISFVRIDKPWLIGIVHFLLSHIFVLFCHFIFSFFLNLSETPSILEHILKSLNDAMVLVLLSLFGGIWILPGFILLSYILARTLLPKNTFR